MNSEYVGFAETERSYIEKDLLRMQLELLNIARNLKAYELLRKQEFLMKIRLKNKLGEVFDLVDVFDKKLPKTSHKIETGEGRKIGRKDREDADLLAEIEEIRRKIEELKRGI